LASIDLFKDAFSTACYKPVAGMGGRLWMVSWEGWGRKPSYLMVVFQSLRGWTEEYTKAFSRDGWSPDQESNLQYPEDETGVLTIYA
jgi:hypothetical protein